MPPTIPVHVQQSVPQTPVNENDRVSVTLRDFVERVFSELRVSHDKLDDAHKEAHDVLDDARWLAHVKVHELVAQALQKQEQVQDLKNAGQNEWRATINDRNAEFATKIKVDGEIAVIRTWAEGQIGIGTNARAALTKRVEDLERENIRIATQSEERRKAQSEETEKRVQSVKNTQWLIMAFFTVISITLTIISFIAARFIH